MTGFNVLANDVQGAPLAIQSLNTSGTLGGVTFTPGGVITYTANVFNALKQGETAYTSFTYLAKDSFNFTATATVSITVNGVSDPPLVDLNGGGPGLNTTVAFVEDQPAVTLASALTIADPDSTNLSAATVTLLNPLDGAAGIAASDPFGRHHGHLCAYDRRAVAQRGRLAGDLPDRAALHRLHQRLQHADDHSALHPVPGLRRDSHAKRARHRHRHRAADRRPAHDCDDAANHHRR